MAKKQPCINNIFKKIDPIEQAFVRQRDEVQNQFVESEPRKDEIATEETWAKEKSSLEN